jgi:hypothetical protein
LVEGLGHCGACHTPRGWAFQEKALDVGGSAYLQGAELDAWSAPNLRGDLRTGLGGWSQDDIVAFLKDGWPTCARFPGAAPGPARGTPAGRQRSGAGQGVGCMGGQRAPAGPAVSATPVLQEPVHVDVGRQWARDAALRRAALVALAANDPPLPVAISDSRLRGARPATRPAPTASALAEYGSKELRSALATVAKPRPGFRQRSVADNVETKSVRSQTFDF